MGFATRVGRIAPLGTPCIDALTHRGDPIHIEFELNIPSATLRKPCGLKVTFTSEAVVLVDVNVQYVLRLLAKR